LRTFLIIAFAVDEIDSRYSSGAFVFAPSAPIHALVIARPSVLT
jgi:hypothetical protein